MASSDSRPASICRMVSDAGAYANFGGSLVNYTTRTMAQGTYVIPKVLDDGYLMIGKARMAFRRVDGK